jgi:hypothetical protein
MQLFLPFIREEMSIVTKLRAERPRNSVLLPDGENDFSLIQGFQTGPWGHPTSPSVRLGQIFPGVKRPEREVNHSVPTLK